MNPEDIKTSYTILVVDDDEQVRESISLLLNEHGYSVVLCANAEDAMTALQNNNIDIVLSDIRMPGASGIELLEQSKDYNSEIPVILMTAYAELETAVDAIRKDAFDFIAIPYKTEHLLNSINKAAKYTELLKIEKNYRLMLEKTVEQRTKELSDALTKVKNVSEEIIQRLISVAEFRDTETGSHISRIGLYANKLAVAFNMPQDFIETISFASPMHDIGKVGIPDNILFKPGSLTRDEFEKMKTHTSIGQKMLSGSSYPGIKMAESIALSHHERWDGTGYPHGLSGKDIPVEARIVMIADQYDALRSERPYRKSLSHEEVFRIITKGDGRTMPGHFDPDVLGAFIKLASSFDETFNTYQAGHYRNSKNPPFVL